MMPQQKCPEMFLYDLENKNFTWDGHGKIYHTNHTSIWFLPAHGGMKVSCQNTWQIEEWCHFFVGGSHLSKFLLVGMSGWTHYQSDVGLDLAQWYGSTKGGKDSKGLCLFTPG